MATSSNAGTKAGQAAGRPEGNAARAWVRTSFPKSDAIRPTFKGGTWTISVPAARCVYVRELPEGGCLMVLDDGTHRTAPKFAPPEGNGWEALHDERKLPDSMLAQNRKSAKLNRKAAAARRLDQQFAELEREDPFEGGEGEAREGGLDPSTKRLTVLPPS